jgi:hypothetical protein
MEIIPQRVCGICNTAYPETPEHFPVNKNSKGGLLGWCRNCRRAYNRDRYRLYDSIRHKRQSWTEKRSRTSKACSACGETKPLSAFVTDQRKSDGRDSRCKICFEKAKSARLGRGGPRCVPGFVYVIRVGDFCKIGLSANPKSRIASLQISTPTPLEVVCILPTKDMIALEKELHQKYVHAHERGEWFDLSESDVEQIRHMNE